MLCILLRSAVDYSLAVRRNGVIALLCETNTIPATLPLRTSIKSVSSFTSRSHCNALTEFPDLASCGTNDASSLVGNERCRKHDPFSFRRTQYAGVRNMRDGRFPYRLHIDPILQRSQGKALTLPYSLNSATLTPHREMICPRSVKRPRSETRILLPTMCSTCWQELLTSDNLLCVLFRRLHGTHSQQFTTCFTGRQYAEERKQFCTL